MKNRRKFKEASIYTILQEIVDRELNDFENYVNEISSDLLAKQEKFETNFSEALNASSDEIDADTYFEDDPRKYFKVLPMYTYNPSLLVLYGFFENWLKELCKFHHERKFSQIKVSDLAGSNYIEKSRRYLILVAEINLNSVDKEWQQIQAIQKIRNCIAHNNSNVITNKNVPIEKQDLYKLLDNDERIHLDNKQGDFYIKDKKFILEVIDLFRFYLKKLTIELSKPKVHARNTSMPYDNTFWGQEKTERLLKDVIQGLKLMDLNETRTDEFKDTDLKFNLRGQFASMAFNLTKLYSFFCDSDWDVAHSTLIAKKGEDGLKELKRLYKPFTIMDVEIEGSINLPPNF
jgi:hypothetical protein